MTSGFNSISLINARIRSSNCPRYLVPATTAVRSSVITRLSKRIGEVRCFTISCANPSTIALLPTPGSPINIGLFFFLRPKISLTRIISFSLPTTGSSLPSVAACVKSVPKLSSTGVFDLVREDDAVLVLLFGDDTMLSSISSSSSAIPIPFLGCLAEAVNILITLL